jgi:hypothetical protein
MSPSKQEEEKLTTAESPSIPPVEKPEPRFIDALKAFVEHPTTKLVVAIILIVSGLIETLDTVKEDVSNLRVRVGHGIILLGLVNAFSSLPPVIDGIERWLKAAEIKRERRQQATIAKAGEKKA